MELRQLEYFMTLCRELHFTRAADKLGITQPTLSHQIKALEDEIGMPLFDRLGKKIAITDVGLILSEQCKNIFGALDNAKEQINELKEMTSGSIAIATLPGELTNLVSTLLLDFHKNHPDVKVRVISSDDIVQLVMQNKIDFAVTIVSSEFSSDDERIIKIPLYADRELSIIPIVQPCISREVSLVLRKDKFVGFGTRKFIELLTNEIIKLRFPITEKSKEQIRELTTI
ncbi:LysR family transcriptional regulator [Domibacillus aminovorans]|uniref:HTH lysR-type domain-containing protein n=1 Tax=Domibacillus aminovorans TaxID=29332 RepID=A0A177L4V2_9BACI|nr:LysR family transcriptional regulator [Domibacillus aminovorans]OAH60709.1 hypothetical protein AWH49_02865 [Domibacillus aminovorans]